MYSSHLALITLVPPEPLVVDFKVVFMPSSQITATPAYFNGRAKRGKPIPVGRAIPYAYGFLLDHELQRFWALRFYADMFKDDLASTSPQKLEETIEILIGMAYTKLAAVIHSEMPHLPRLRTRLVPLYEYTDEVYCIFVSTLR